MRTFLVAQRPIATQGAVVLPALATPEIVQQENVFPKKPLSAKLHYAHIGFKPNVLLHGVSRVWWYAFAVFAAFVLLNVGIASYYSNRVFPGVHVGSVAVGDRSFATLPLALSGLSAAPSLTARIGTVTYPLNTDGMSAISLGSSVLQAEEYGRSAPLPLFGLIEALASRPLTVQRNINASLLNKVANGLADAVDHTPSNAVPIIYNGQAFVIGEKTGSELDPSRIASEIRQNYGNASSFEMSPDPISPKVTAASYASDLSAAQAMLELKLVLQNKNVIYSPTAQQIGTWLTFAGPGKGVSVSSSAVATYVNSLTGQFDRLSAAAALLKAVQTRQQLTYVAAMTPIRSAPIVATSVVSFSNVYTYCVQSDSSVEGDILLSSASNALSDPQSWNLGGKLNFVNSATNCNFTFWLAPASELGSLSSRCSSQTTCQVGNILAINANDWLTVPTGWTEGLAAYRQELINHTVGQWLGFNHASCLAVSETPMPILEAPTVVLDGCSPNWFQLPQGLAGAAVLQGF
jgi:hypothetical protein